VSKEVEIKFQLELDKISFLKSWMDEHSIFYGVRNITDYYLDNPKSSYYFESSKGYTEVLDFLRVRITDEKHYLCYKKRYVDQFDKTISVDELEVVIEDGLETVEILEKAGYVSKIKIEKTRHIFVYKEIFEIVFDDVTDLGAFVEIEIKDEMLESVESGKQKIYDLLRRIGLPEVKQFDRGYLSMFLNPDYDFSEIVKL